MTRLHWRPTLTSATSLYGYNSLGALLLRGAQPRSLCLHGSLHQCPRSRHFDTPWEVVRGSPTEPLGRAANTGSLWRPTLGRTTRPRPPPSVAAQMRGRRSEAPALITPCISLAWAPPHLVWRWSKRLQPHFRLHPGHGAPPPSSPPPLSRSPPSPTGSSLRACGRRAATVEPRGGGGRGQRGGPANW